MITIFENCGFIYKIEANNHSGVKVYHAVDTDAIERFRVGLISTITWEIDWRS